MAQYRIGIDVGGTFTHAVALDAATFELVAQVKVPTTHYAARGVSEGVIEALRRLLAESGLSPAEIVFVAYSTTQITNALLGRRRGRGGDRGHRFRDGGEARAGRGAGRGC